MISLFKSSFCMIGSLLAAVSFGVAAETDGNDWSGHWPKGKDPAEVGTRIAENFLPRQFRYQLEPGKEKDGIVYPEVITWYGSLRIAKLTKNAQLRESLIRKMDAYLTEPGSAYVNPKAHVDYRVLGILPLEIFLQNQDPRCRELGMRLADAQWQTTTPDGITTEARYWIDDMYMIPALQVQAFRVTRDAKYLDRAALAMCSYFDRLQKENGLFFHGENSHFFWGRGNGWMAAGSAELLSELPENHPKRPHILAGYRKMMAALLKYQNPAGLWSQLIDQPDSWTETSGSAMFAYGMILGAKRGWLDSATYGPAARKAWLALVDHLDEKANLREVCVGTNKGFDTPYYLNRPRVAGDFHGQGAMLWCADALLR